ncbi:MAG TPA: hypothetical protein VNG71_07125 [Pyrinomonadaceae bacterium]|nr:hypothetical protein [Pyrinomonadaceae bacterium]
MNRSTKHLEFETLLDIADGRLTRDSDQTAHLKNCTACTGELQRVENLLTVMKEDKSVDAPRDVLAYAVSLFARREQKPSLVQRIVAALSFDSFDNAPAFGVRSNVSTARQLIYTAGENDIDLRIAEDEDNRWVVAGQILGEHCAGGEISLHGYEVSTSAYLSEQCEFALPAVPAGNYELVLRLTNVEVEVPRLEIGV